MPRPLIPDHILEIPPYPRGKPWRGLEEVRLSANENPLGPPPKALEEIRSSLAALHRYPDGLAEVLKEELAQYLGLDPANLALGNGSNEVIEMAVKVFLRDGEEVVLPAPSFAYYGIAVKARGGKCIEVPLRDFRIDLEAMARAVTPRTRLIFLGNPNNPTGTIFGLEEFKALLEEVPEEVVVVVDEAYGEFVTAEHYPSFRDYLEMDRWILSLRTFSKFFGLAGLRVGYGIGRGELVDLLERVHQPFNVNLLGIAGAIGALKDREFQERTRRVVAEGKDFLTAAFEELDIPFVASEANFFLFYAGERKGELLEYLEGEGVVVRDMEGYGLGGYLRVSVGLPEENRRFVEVLKAWKAREG